MENELEPAVFIESEPRISLESHSYEKSFVLKVEAIYFSHVALDTKFEDIKEHLVNLAKKYIDEAPLYSSKEYDDLYLKRYNRWKKEIEEENKNQ